MTRILLNIPNLIGYLRLLLLAFAWFYLEKPMVFLPFYVSQVLLDAVDGWAARRFNQLTKFGAWLDVIIDNIGRGILWTNISSLGIVICSIEWMTFVALNSHGSNWKSKLASTNDLIVRNIMKNGSLFLIGLSLFRFLWIGFRTPFGFLTIVLGIHSLPIIIYMIKHQVLFDWSPFLLYNIKNICIIGRLFSFYCEVYVIRLFISEELLDESK